MGRVKVKKRIRCYIIRIFQSRSLQLIPKPNSCLLESQSIREIFAKYFNIEITFDDSESGLSKVKGALKNLSSETQWVPRNWVYS